MPDGTPFRATLYTWHTLPPERWGLASLSRSATPAAACAVPVAHALARKCPWDNWAVVEQAPRAVWDAIWRALEDASADASKMSRAQLIAIDYKCCPIRERPLPEDFPVAAQHAATSGAGRANTLVGI